MTVGGNSIGIIGSGNIGGVVARLAIAAGMDVMVSNSRGPASLRGLVAELGPGAHAGTAEQAAVFGNWTVVAVPFKAAPHLPAQALAGRTVIDTNNYYRFRDGDMPEFADARATAGEVLQRYLPQARLVKAFNTIYFVHLLTLARPSGSPERSAIPIVGDDPVAKGSVTQLLDRLGYDAVDAGTTAESYRVEEGSPAYVVPYLSDRRLPWTEDPGKPTSATEIAAAVSAARPR